MCGICGVPSLYFFPGKKIFANSTAPLATESCIKAGQFDVPEYFRLEKKLQMCYQRSLLFWSPGIRANWTRDQSCSHTIPNAKRNIPSFVFHMLIFSPQPLQDPSSLQLSGGITSAPAAETCASYTWLAAASLTYWNLRTNWDHGWLSADTAPICTRNHLVWHQNNQEWIL